MTNATVLDLLCVNSVKRQLAILTKQKFNMFLSLYFLSLSAQAILFASNEVM